MDIVIIEIDLAMNSCSLAGMDALGRVVLRRQMGIILPPTVIPG